MRPKPFISVTDHQAGYPDSTLCPENIQKAVSYKSKSTGKFVCAKWIETSNGNLSYKPSHNVAPTDVTPVLVSGSHFDSNLERVLHPMMWGMIPTWHKGEPKSHGLSTNNCRLEGMIGSKLYGRAFSKGNRCVIVCDGFYEWQTTKGKGNKQPYFIYMNQPEGVRVEEPNTWSDEWSEEEGWKGPKLLAMAGLFDIWKSPQNHPEAQGTIAMRGTHSRRLSKMRTAHARRDSLVWSKRERGCWLARRAARQQRWLSSMVSGLESVSWELESRRITSTRAGFGECTHFLQGEVIYSYTVITTESNETLSWLHHRAPAILYTEEQIDSWLDHSSVKSEKALHSIKPVKSLVWHPVATLVNNSRNKDTNCNKLVSLEKSTPNSASSMFMKAWLKKPETKVKREISEDECSKDVNDKSKRIKTDLESDLK
uniref:Abasic site processing protein HMCES n=1 Tax=Timema tahoe TaxID=61484 RepID=A0A7R9IKG0_9NEOP|nr:unnamed protein product [Timema tahoe]